MNLSEEALAVGADVAAALPENLIDVLNRAISHFIGWPYETCSGSIIDQDGAKSACFSSVIIALPAGSVKPCSDAIPADLAGAVIDVSESMDLAGLRAAYARIGQVKRLRKSAGPRVDGPRTNVTLGIILARGSEVPLEALAGELEQLNIATSSKEWPDMILIAGVGAINYAIQFPGESVSGDYLPPQDGGVTNYTPPFYVVIVIRPVGAYWFNKMEAYLVAHLNIFSPGARLPNFGHLLEGVSPTAVTVSGFQYDLKGALLPVPRRFYNDRYLPPRPLRIEDRKGKLLSTIEFLPWQDGGTVLLKGKLPLEGIMIFMGKQGVGGTIRRPPDMQISNVLPITPENFAQMLNRFQAQSNMVVKRDEGKWVVQEVAKEGSTSPSMARLIVGLLRLRDSVYSEPAIRDAFDKRYELVNSSLMSARSTAKEIVHLWERHKEKIASGEIARLEGQNFRIYESIDKELRKEIESFLNAAVRALKTGMQNVAAELRVNIGFLFKKQNAFDAGIAALRLADPLLGEYLIQSRTWAERLIGTRNAIEHKGWALPRVKYVIDGSAATATEPEVSGQPMTVFVMTMLDRMCCFVEEVTIHCLQQQLPAEITITEIPASSRPAELPERFRVTAKRGGRIPWEIVYHAETFEQV